MCTNATLNPEAPATELIDLALAGHVEELLAARFQALKAVDARDIEDVREGVIGWRRRSCSWRTSTAWGALAGVGQMAASWAVGGCERHPG
jgi:hypothetical protein